MVEAVRPRLANRLARPIRRFLAIETASSVLLLVAALAFRVGSFELSLGLSHWVNDALMAIFFFVVGLEIKREMTIGELASRERAMLPVFGAIGGMAVPAGIYLLLAPAGDAALGWGIPMATDIAFAVAALAILGPRVAPGLKVFLLALAIVDDLGAVTVIAVFYTDEIRLTALFAAAGGMGLVYLTRLAGVRAYAPYFILGGVVWLATLGSGVHATVAGVLLGVLTPVHAPPEALTLVARLKDQAEEAMGRLGEGGSHAHAPEQLLIQVRDLSREALSPLEYLVQKLHPWVAFVVMPIFALANAGVPLDASTLGEDPGMAVAIAVAAGLLIGKPIGITLFALGAVKLGIASLPPRVTGGAVFGAGLLGGIGFTMALFITALAFGTSGLASAAKVGVLSASLLCCVLGLLVLYRVLPEPPGKSGDTGTTAPSAPGS
jgi:NhaA family Na+:H+ antiporter